MNIEIGAAKASTLYRVECRDKAGNLKWIEEVPNLVVNAGLDYLLTAGFKNGAITSWFVGLKGTGSAAAGDTIASHAGWSQVSDYTGDRKGLTLGSVSGQSVSNTASKATFAINDTATVAGAFVCSAETGTTGTLYGVADFASSRATEDGDTLEVTVTLTSAAA